MMTIPNPSQWNRLVASGCEVFPWIVTLVAREALVDSARGVAWVNALIVATGSPAVTRAYLAKELRQDLSPDSVTALVALLAQSSSPWARLGACEALQGPWGRPARPSLENALNDTTELADMDCCFRISDEAAIAFYTSGVSPESSPFQIWRSRTTDELQTSGITRELAAIALARMDDPRAQVVLAELSCSSYQAKVAYEHVLESLRSIDVARG